VNRGAPLDRPRSHRAGLALVAALLGAALGSPAGATPYVPTRDEEVLASLPAGIRHTTEAVREQASARLDVALPLARFYISQARSTGDLRFLGYAQGVLEPWRRRTPPLPAVLVLHATILQSRHAFPAALAELDEAVAAQGDDAQAWVTRASVLRVLGRYGEASASCAHLADVDSAVGALCVQSLRGLTGHLDSAYAALLALPQETLSDGARAWRYSELGEMATRQGNSAAAAHWYREGLDLVPDDAYTRAAYADLLLSEGQAAETLKLLAGYESMEPLLLRIALAQQRLHEPQLAQSRALLAGAFSVEEQRGEAVHRREQACYLLEVAQYPSAALRAARENWEVQREPADVLILLRAAQAAGRPDAADAAVQFVRRHGLEDARLRPYLGSSG